MKAVGFVLALAIALTFVSAVDCSGEHDMPQGSWTYSAWLCVSGSSHGWIYSIAPPTHPAAGSMFKVELTTFTYSLPYPATLTCYEQFTDVEPPSRIGGKSGFGTLNSVPQGPLHSWHLLQQVTLTDGQSTSSGSPWVLAGCPPVKNLNHQSGSPPQVQIGISWSGYGGMRATAVAAPDYISIGAPYYSALGGYTDALAGRTASTLKTKRTRR
ncbi:MAG: hypothetical protein V1881_00565 [Candidatus Micrarchaeota archaeon]